VDDLLEIGWGVAWAACSHHPVDQCGLMGMVVKSAGIVGVIICLLFEGSVDEVVNQVVIAIPEVTQAFTIFSVSLKFCS
jgi:hypothetical protein